MEQVSDLMYQAAMILLPVLVTLIIAGVKYGITYLQAQTAKVNNEVGQKVLNDALGQAEIVAIDAIRATNQVFVEELKKGRADGKLTKEEAQEALNKAKEYFIAHMSSESLSILEESMGSVQEWIESFLEAKLAQNKTEEKIMGLANPFSSEAST